MVKVLSFIFQQCFCVFTMLLVEGSSETGLFRDLSNQVFRSRKFKNTSALKVIFFLDMFKIKSKFRKCKKKIQKMFLVSEIIASENVAVNCLSQEANTCHKQSMG